MLQTYPPHKEIPSFIILRFVYLIFFYNFSHFSVKFFWYERKFTLNWIFFAFLFVYITNMVVFTLLASCNASTRVPRWTIHTLLRAWFNCIFFIFSIFFIFIIWIDGVGTTLYRRSLSVETHHGVYIWCL